MMDMYGGIAVDELGLGISLVRESGMTEDDIEEFCEKTAEVMKMIGSYPCGKRGRDREAV